MGEGVLSSKEKGRERERKKSKNKTRDRWKMLEGRLEGSTEGKRGMREGKPSSSNPREGEGKRKVDRAGVGFVAFSIGATNTIPLAFRKLGGKRKRNENKQGRK